MNYKNNEYKYIITYIEEYNTLLDTSLNYLFNIIYPHYLSGELRYSNVCGGNTEFICKKLTKTGITAGKIIITDWLPKNSKLLKTIESVYGSIIGSTYHALPYLTVIIEETNYYVAIETTISVPYNLQFYVGSNEDKFAEIIKTRYQCSNFKISFDCDKHWIDIAYNNMGGKTKKNEKTKKNKKRKTKKRKTKNKKRKTKTKMGVFNTFRTKTMGN